MSQLNKALVAITIISHNRKSQVNLQQRNANVHDIGVMQIL